MFLKLATVLVILGLLLTLLMSLVHQGLLAGRMFGSSMILIYRLMTFGEILCFNVPLIIFFVAFFLSLKAKQN
jgi:hypothetical protein